MLAPLCQSMFKFGTSIRKGTVCYFVRFQTRSLLFLTERALQAPHTQRCTNGATLCVCGASRVYHFVHVTSPAPPHTFEILWISNVCAARPPPDPLLVSIADRNKGGQPSGQSLRALALHPPPLYLTVRGCEELVFFIEENAFPSENWH